MEKLHKDLDSSSSLQTPASLGYSMPPEWAPHEATWLAWPHNFETWPGKRLKEVEEIFLTMIEALLPGEKVKLLVNDQNAQARVPELLKKRGVENLKNLILLIRPTADVWIRDYGPTFIAKSGSKAWCKWIFNAWGGKYPNLAQDNQVFDFQRGQTPVSFVRGLTPIGCFDAGFVLEGGSIEVNGEGICMVTEQCLLNKNRNPQLSRAEIEQKLRDYLGANEILWLREGIVGDDTDGHMDDIARFVDSKTLLAAYEDDSHDENHPLLKENWKILESASRKEIKRWNLVKLPMPGKVVDEGERLPASYANFYIANQAVLLPVYRHKNDERAIKILAELFPKRLIVPIISNALIYGLGAIHCVTQQEPMPVIPARC